MIDFIENLVNIPSYTGNHKATTECLNICKKIFKNSNVFIKETEINNYQSVLFSNYDSLDFEVMSVCHIDVVPNYEYKITQKNNIIYGRGVFDMKSFVVSSLANLKYLIDNKINTKYGVLITSDEETGGENGAKYWVDNIKIKANVILDSDSGNNINSIVLENLGAITIRLDGEQKNVKKTIENIKNKFKNFYCEDFGKEMDINFPDLDIIKILNENMYKNTNFEILMLNKYFKNNLHDQYHKMYKKMASNNRVEIEYITTSNTNDSRYFSNIGINIISHQATGGDNHKQTEWLDLNSFHIHNKIQNDFLVSLKTKY